MERDGQGTAPVQVEVLTFSAHHESPHYRDAITELAGRHPDTAAGDLAGGTVLLLHSTSWRYRNGSVILTYVAVLDDTDDHYRELGAHTIAHSGDPTAPSPPHVCADAVATHAARHLAWLRENDEAVATTLAGLPRLWHALDRFKPGPAGALPPTAASRETASP